jgi:hypothetical protein
MTDSIDELSSPPTPTSLTSGFGDNDDDDDDDVIDDAAADSDVANVYDMSRLAGVSEKDFAVCKLDVCGSLTA